MDKVALGPGAATKGPLVAVFVLLHAVAAVVNGVVFFICRDEITTAGDAVLEGFHRRQLAEVSGDNGLNAAKGVIVAAGPLHDGVEPLEVQILDHADLVDDDGVCFVETPVYHPFERCLFQLLEPPLVAVRGPPRVSPSGRSGDGQGSLACWRHDLNHLAHVAQACYDSTQNDGLAAAGGPGVKDVAAAGGELDKLQLLGAEGRLSGRLGGGLRGRIDGRIGGCLAQCERPMRRRRQRQRLDVWGFISARAGLERGQAEDMARVGRPLRGELLYEVDGLSRSLCIFPVEGAGVELSLTIPIPPRHYKRGLRERTSQVVDDDGRGRCCFGPGPLVFSGAPWRRAVSWLVASCGENEIATFRRLNTAPKLRNIPILLIPGNCDRMGAFLISGEATKRSVG